MVLWVMLNAHKAQIIAAPPTVGVELQMIIVERVNVLVGLALIIMHP
jgi:hypothetical protein